MPPELSRFPLNITLYDLVFLGAIFVGLTFVLLLLFAKRINRMANIFLGLSLLTIVLWVVWVLAIDIRLGNYFPHWSWLPLQYSLTLGPLLYFYVRRLTRPHTLFKIKDLLHFSPLLLEQGVQLLQVIESERTQRPTYDTVTFNHLNPLLQFLALISVISYLLISLSMLKGFHHGLKENFSDAGVYQYRWLGRLLIVFGLLWLLWIPFVAVDFIYYHYSLGISSYYPLYLLLAVMTIWISAQAFLRPEVILVEVLPPATHVLPEVPGDELLARGEWLRQQMETNLFYLDANLSLRSLADELGMHPNELSRIANIALGKSFSDFVNEYRVQAVIEKMQDPAFDPITLLGIAFNSGFNSKTSFNRTFKQFTGKTPAAYKAAQKTSTIL